MQPATAESLNTDRLRTLSRGEYDELAFGIVELDRDGIVRTYNRSESSLARREPEQTIGKQFFRDVAPCTDTVGFRGKIEALMAEGVAVDSEARFDYTFKFPWGSRRVRIRALRGDTSCWMFITPLHSFDEDKP